MDDFGNQNQKSLSQALGLFKRPQAPTQVFLCAHMDTVFPIGHPFQTITELDENTINGPGVADLKGGIVVMLKAIEAFEHHYKTNWAGKFYLTLMRK